MGRQKLSLKTLPRIGGGKLDVKWMQLIEAAINDCYDRPAEAGKRTVTITAVITPVPDGDTCDNVNTHFEFGTKIPKYASRTYNMGIQQVSGQKSLVFNDEAVDNADQLDLYESDPEEE